MLHGTLDSKSAALARVSPNLAKDENAEYSVVGVSHFEENFHALKSVLGKSDGEEATVGVVLRHEPENVNSASRSAIAVYSSGLHLGHIPDVAAQIFADLFRRSAGLARAEARAYFGTNGPNSLRLRIAWPPRFEDDEEPAFDLLWLKGDGEYAFPMRTSKYPISWESLLERNHNFPELEIGEIFIGDDGVLTAGEFGRSPYFSCKYGHIAKPKVADEYLVNRHVSALGGQVRVKYQLIRTGPRSHELTLDWNIKSKSQQKSKSISSINPAHIVQPVPTSSILEKQRRWPGEEDYEIHLGSARVASNKKQRRSLGWDSEVFIKVLKVIGKVLLYMTLGLFIITVMAVMGILKDTLKQNDKKW
jgi:hypothetical protein